VSDSFTSSSSRVVVVVVVADTVLTNSIVIVICRLGFLTASTDLARSGVLFVVSLCTGCRRRPIRGHGRTNNTPTQAFHGVPTTRVHVCSSVCVCLWGRQPVCDCSSAALNQQRKKSALLLLAHGAAKTMDRRMDGWMDGFDRYKSVPSPRRSLDLCAALRCVAFGAWCCAFS